jgi:hypothetical protein
MPSIMLHMRDWCSLVVVVVVMLLLLLVLVLVLVLLMMMMLLVLLVLCWTLAGKIQMLARYFCKRL